MTNKKKKKIKEWDNLNKPPHINPPPHTTSHFFSPYFFLFRGLLTPNIQIKIF